MPFYRYQALSANGALVRGERVAAAPEQLAAELQQQGLRVLKLRERAAGRRFARGERVTPEVFLLFNQELVALLRAGLTVPDALVLVSQRPEAPRFGQVLQRVLEAVRGGAALSVACARYPQVFDALYVAALRTGEKSGRLWETLARHQGALKRSVALRKKVSQALAYPAFLLIALTLVLGVLFAFVLPRFTALYADFGVALPWPTRLLMGFVHHLPLVAAAALAMAAALWAGWRRAGRSEALQLALDRLRDRLPFFGAIRRAEAVATLARALATLLAGGTPLVEALGSVREALASPTYRRGLRAATQQVIGGESLSRALLAQQLVPAAAAQMLAVGEATGALDSMLAEIAQYQEELLEHRLARAMVLIEPLLMLLMGLLVGGIILVMYLPIFHLADVIQ